MLLATAGWDGNPFNSWWTSVFFLFQGFASSNFDYSIFNGLEPKDLRVYGQVVFAIYTVSGRRSSVLHSESSRQLLSALQCSPFAFPFRAGPVHHPAGACVWQALDACAARESRGHVMGSQGASD